MTLPAKAFQRWLQGIAPDVSTADVCRVSGIKRTTLAQQLVRGKVSVSTVVSISRAYSINPVSALAGFESYSVLAGPPQPPTRCELVSQISTADLLRAALARPAMDPLGRQGAAPPPLSPVPHASSVKNWVDAIDDGEVRHRVSAATGIAPQNYSAQLTANRLSPELAVATSVAAGVGPAGGLVATGLITEEEAGWAPGARQDALDSMSDGDLTALVGDRMQALGKVLRRQEQDQAQTEKIWENLG
ncbi:conserved hypothetical protein [Pseudarthrobacter chlorophenolicus A6]|uniref:Uncharacterized protein n=1 Tax=Pseudarthrobacter chlorophenolicus (strain ATCC 700700 / DSM 12829 / CIP 107037 / JCM 12360 / KCTC 9906 / NCIMB 13794 / A6) TaxID=452863 RepID=B8HDB2_PSECP|nr:hypothetical protein [Pseudarthrobacter chlorophenolicus]ACL38917.1 conserved hypothetical protein [Pseudarthrobacter chlorophenolicus A6]SDR07002.1 hypothetical protein SAMN04489738_4608 [Pseudarthrobacter chlorophenolicus]